MRGCILALLAAGAVRLQETPQAVTDAFGDDLPKHALARLGTGRLRHEAAVSAVAFFPDGNKVASAGTEGRLCVWDARGGKRRLKLEAHQDGVLSIAVCPKGLRLLSAGRDETARLWDAESGRELRRF